MDDISSPLLELRPSNVHFTSASLFESILSPAFLSQNLPLLSLAPPSMYCWYYVCVLLWDFTAVRPCPCYPLLLSPTLFIHKHALVTQSFPQNSPEAFSHPNIPSCPTDTAPPSTFKSIRAIYITSHPVLNPLHFQPWLFPPRPIETIFLKVTPEREENGFSAQQAEASHCIHIGQDHRSQREYHLRRQGRQDAARDHSAANTVLDC